MSEHLIDPAETANQVIRQAVELGHAIVGFDDEQMDGVEDTIKNLDNAYPYVNKDCKLWGRVLTPIVDDEGMITGRVFMHTTSITEGIHKGFGVVGEIMLMDDEVVGIVPRIAHVIQTSENTIQDLFGKIINEKNHDYVMVEDTEDTHVMPFDTENTHSLQELKDDPVCEQIDLIVTDEYMDIQDKLESLQKLFTIEPDVRPTELNLWMQRVSYLNLLELLEGVTIISPFASRSLSNYEYVILVPEGSGVITFDSAERFELVPEVRRSDDKGVMESSDRLRLGVGGFVDDGDFASALLYNDFIADIKT